ncbi:hypothetical protein BGZ58_010830 [Dissophora ornata]|nr:hypothetical protein BGZ58_010830 [Dissophora ornata]
MSKSPLVSKILQGLTSICDKDSMQNSMAVPIIGSILAFTQSRSSNYLQLVMGLYLYSAGCARKVVDVLHGAGLCVSYPTVNQLLEDLTKDALKEVKLAAQRHPWFLVYDNINFSRRKHDQRIDNKDEFESGTTATLIIGENPGLVQPTRDSYSRFRVNNFLINKADIDHFDKVCGIHMIEELKKFLGGFNRCSTPTIEIHLLPVEKTKTYPLELMKINEGSVEGNKAVVETVTKMLGLEEEYFDDDKMIIFAGDLATVKNLRSLKSQREDERTKCNRMDWITPVA